METVQELAEPDDLALIERVNAGDRSAFDTLMRRHNRQLYRAVRSILRDDGEAEDAVQEAWWKAYCHLKEFRADAQPATWLTRIAVNEALMHLRRNRTRDAHLEPVPLAPPDADDKPVGDALAALPETNHPDELTWRAEVRRLIESGVDGLPPALRTIFMLRAVEGMSMAEIGAVLDRAGEHGARALHARAPPVACDAEGRHRPGGQWRLLVRRPALRPHGRRARRAHARRLSATLTLLARP